MFLVQKVQKTQIFLKKDTCSHCASHDNPKLIPNSYEIVSKYANKQEKRRKTQTSCDTKKKIGKSSKKKCYNNINEYIKRKWERRIRERLLYCTLFIHLFVEATVNIEPTLNMVSTRIIKILSNVLNFLLFLRTEYEWKKWSKISSADLRKFLRKGPRLYVDNLFEWEILKINEAVTKWFRCDVKILIIKIFASFFVLCLAQSGFKGISVESD